MNLVDANVLIYATNASDPKHDPSREWLERALNESATVGFPWVALLAWLRLTTKVGLFPDPLDVGAALTVMRSWLARPASVVVHPTARHLDVLAGLLVESGTGGNLTTDAHLAALAIEHGATVVTWDGDFDRFVGVRWQRPDA
jgi:toxin-antitoxin system PIN domain toxin